MISSVIPDMVSIVLAIITSTIAGRALFLYARIRTSRLFVLGLSMGIIALTGIADLAASHITSVTLHTDWFLYLGQAVGFFFIFLSLIKSSSDYQHRLIGWHIAFSIAALLLLCATPVLPNFPNLATEFSLRATRCVLCFMIFFYYTATFMSKQARFSLLMAGAFLLLSFGYLLIILQYTITIPGLFDNLGDIVRIGGLILLLVAVLAG